MFFAMNDKNFIKKINILIVEDEKAMSDYLSRILKKSGYEISAVISNGLEAIKTALKTPIDLILMDITLNGELDGIETAVKIKEKKNIPIVFLTAHFENEYFERARKILPYGYIIKPVDKNILYTTLETIIDRIKLEKQLEYSEKLYNEKLEMRINERTRELVAANNELQQQILTRMNAEKELKNHKERLEEIIFERTRELIAANSRLKEEITERKRNERDLLKALAAADNANKAKGEFLAAMSHAIRTPMNGIIGISELALSNDINERQKEYFNDIKISAEALLTVINDILDYSKIESGNLSVEKITMNLYDTVENALNLVAVRAFQKGVELMCEIKENIGEFIIGDPYRIRQIILNLVTNAIKFTHKGEIKITLSTIDEKQETAGVNFDQNNNNRPGDNHNHTLLISVSDTGIGIKKDRLDKIFESFKQAESSTTRKYGGTGLGLSISKHLAEAMKGRLSVRSVYGKGSVFTLELPVKFVKPDLKQDSEIEFQNFKNCCNGVNKILITDVNEENVKIIQRAISSFCDAKIITARGGREALEIILSSARTNRPVDILITGHKTPELDGLALAEKIKTISASAWTKIIIMSAACDMPPVIAGNQNSFQKTFINKPVKKRELKKLLCGINKIKSPSAINHNAITAQNNGSSQQPDCGGSFSYDNITALIAEDNEINLKIIKEILNKKNIKNIFTASNGEEAVKLFKNKNIDIIFMDIQMPVLDGYRAAEKIRNSGRPDKDIPIIAITANALKGDREKCLQAQMTDYIAKPFKPADIYEMLYKYLTHKSVEKTKSIAAAENNNVRLNTEAAFDYMGFLAVLEGNRDIFKELILAFKDELASDIKKIENLIKEKKYDELKFHAHNIKGAAGNLFVFAIEKTARIIEEKISRGEFKKLSNLSVELKKAYEEFIKITEEAFRHLMI